MPAVHAYHLRLAAFCALRADGRFAYWLDCVTSNTSSGIVWLLFELFILKKFLRECSTSFVWMYLVVFIVDVIGTIK